MKFVSPPARNDVQMQVLGDTRAGNLTEVQAEIESIGVHRVAQRRYAFARQPHDLNQLLIIQRREVTDMAVGRHHEVPRRVGKRVEHHQACPTTGDNEARVALG